MYSQYFGGTNKQVAIPNTKLLIVAPKQRRLLRNPSQIVFQHISGDRFKTASENSVFLAHYPAEDKEHLSGQVNRLSFIHQGSQEPVDVRPYSKTCTSIDFKGHIESTNAVFGIIEQLPKLKDVTIYVRHPQRKYYRELTLKTPGCPSVKNLKIVIAKNVFEYYDWHKSARVPSGAADKYMGMRSSLIRLAGCLLIQARGSFPNLEKIDLQLPNSNRIASVAYSFYWSFRWYRKKMQLGLQQAPSCAKRNQVYKGMAFRRDEKNWRKLGFKSTFKQRHRRRLLGSLRSKWGDACTYVCMSEYL